MDLSRVLYVRADSDPLDLQLTDVDITNSAILWAAGHYRVPSTGMAMP
jgi:hypothetical protein